MEATKTAALDTLISQLDSQILAVEGLGIPGTKLLLTMARLDLQAKRHDIADHELRALCVTIERAMDADHGRRRTPRAARRARNSVGAKPMRADAAKRVSSDETRTPA
jgi:hypothetical protein